MRLVLLSLALALIACAQFLSGATIPLTTREISLMLRSGYSSQAVMNELSKRHFGDVLDAATEKQLGRAGATPALLDALRNGAFQASAAEISSAREKIRAQEAALESHQDEVSLKTEPRPKPPGANNPGNQVYQLLKGDLVYYHQGAISHFDDEGLERKKYYLFFFSAIWAPAGRKFTPTLTEFYNRVEPQHPEFEIIFFSADRSQFGMETYLRESNMPWPSVAYPKINEKAAGMETKVVSEIPALVLVNSAGQILSQTRSGQNGKTPEKILAEIDQLLTGATQVARSK